MLCGESDVSYEGIQMCEVDGSGTELLDLRCYCASTEWLQEGRVTEGGKTIVGIDWLPNKLVKRTRSQQVLVSMRHSQDSAYSVT